MGQFWWSDLKWVFWGLQTSHIPLLVNVGARFLQKVREKCYWPVILWRAHDHWSLNHLSTSWQMAGGRIVLHLWESSANTHFLSEAERKYFQCQILCTNDCLKPPGLCVWFWLAGSSSVTQHSCSEQWTWFTWQDCPQPISLVHLLPAFCSIGEIWWIAFGSHSKHIPLKSVFWI